VFACIPSHFEWYLALPLLLHLAIGKKSNTNPGLANCLALWLCCWFGCGCMLECK
jgi:hypothetical protein